MLNQDQQTHLSNILSKWTAPLSIIRFIDVYRPPPSTDNALTVDLFFNEFFILMDEAITSNAELLIVGDFNFHVDVSDDGNSTGFSSPIADFNLKQHVRVSTHPHSHILDLEITRSDTDVSFLTNLSTLEQPISDHKPIRFNLNLEKPLKARKTIVSRRLKGLDINKLNDAIPHSGLLDETPGLDSLLQMYDATLLGAFAKLAPLKSRTITLHPHAPWYTDEIAAEKRPRRRLENIWRSSKLECDKVKFLSQCDIVNQLLHGTKEDCFSTLIEENSHKLILLFRYVNKLLNKNLNKNYPTAENNVELANAFDDFFQSKVDGIRRKIADGRRVNNRQFEPCFAEELCCSSVFSSFVPLTDVGVIGLIKNKTIKSCSLDALPAAVMRKCYLTLVPALRNIINLSLTTGEMPRDLKTAMVKPLLKKSNSDSGDFVNFRPVSNLKFVSKLIEKAVFLQLNTHLTTNALREPLFFSFLFFSFLLFDFAPSNVGQGNGLLRSMSISPFVALYKNARSIISCQ